MKYLILGGGGTTCVSYLGAMQYLYENNEFDDLEEIVGCSMGSVIGCLIALNYSPKDILRMYFNVSVSTDKFDYMNFFENWGVDDYESHVFFEIRQAIKVKCGIDNPTIGYISRLNNIKINIVCLNLLKNEYEVMQDGMSIIEALRATMCIPFYTKKCIYNENIYLDPGCKQYSFAYDFFDEKGDKDNIVGFRVPQIYKVNGKPTIMDYIMLFTQYCIAEQSKSINNRKIKYKIYEFYSKLPLILFNWSKHNAYKMLSNDFLYGYEMLVKKR